MGAQLTVGADLSAGSDLLIEHNDIVLVTGANGFIGRAVVQMLLSYGFTNVRCLTRPTSRGAALQELAAKPGGDRLEVVTGNLLSPDDCDRAVAGAKVIYHLAAGVEKSYAGCFLNSVVATRNVLEAALKGGSLRRFVNVSSIAVYGNYGIPRRGLLDESCALDPEILERHEPYTYGKLRQDELVLSYAARHQFGYVIVRPGVVFGPGKRKISDRVGTSTFGLFLHLGHGNRIPLTYVDNCADAIVLAGVTPGIDGNVFIITDDDLPTSRQFLRGYKRAVGGFASLPVPYLIWNLFCRSWEAYSSWSEGQLPPVFNRRACSVYWKGNRYSNERAKRALGWRPRIAMRDGLDRFFDYVGATRPV